MSITEPATLATDYLMAVLAIVWARNLRIRRSSAQSNDWSSVFFALAAASFIGGTYHGFQNAMSPALQWACWQVTLILSFLSSMFLLFAGTGQFGNGSLRMGWRAFGIAKFGLSFCVGVVAPVFMVVLADFAVTMIVVAGMAAGKWTEMRPAATRFFSGLLLFILAGLVQALKLAPHPSFNHNDLFHVIQIAGNFMFYLCARGPSAR